MCGLETMVTDLENNNRNGRCVGQLGEANCRSEESGLEVLCIKRCLTRTLLKNRLKWAGHVERMKEERL